MTATANDLNAGFEILWYKIESVLGRGGFGITYLATDTNLGQLVAIKEYLPHDFASRSGDSTVQPASVDQSDMYVWGLERFMSEAQTLAKFKHKNIVRVLSVFKHNNTGYMVMEYEEGEDLSNIYKSGKKFSQQELEKIYYPIMDGLASVHKDGFIHRDIKPANIFIRKDGSPVLIDFGAARQAVGNKTQALTAMLSVGYAPFEQYNDASGRQGPWTDIYALGASMYQGITGNKPMESTVRGMALVHLDPDPYESLSRKKIDGFSYDFLRAIDQSLKLQITERPQNLEEFLAELKGEIHLPELPPEKPEPKFDETLIRPPEREFKGRQINTEQSVIKTEISKDDDDLTQQNELKQPETIIRKVGDRSKLLIGFSFLLLIVVVAYFLWPEKTPEQILQQEIETLLRDAEKFIENDRYFSKEGDSAYQRYSMVLKLQPDNVNANTGIRNVAQYYLAQAEQFISHQKLTEAKFSTDIVNYIDAGFPGLAEIQAKLDQDVIQLKKSELVFALMGKAREALNKNNFYQPLESSALSYFNKVLHEEPDNISALQGINRIAEKIIDDINYNLNLANYGEAEGLFILTERVDIQRPEMVDFSKKLSVTKNLTAMLKKADSAYANKQFTKPDGENAVELYTKSLEIFPENQHVRKQLKEIADYYDNRTREYIQAGDVRSAAVNLKTLTGYFPEYDNIDQLTAELTLKEKQLLTDKKIMQEKKRLAAKQKLAAKRKLEARKKLAAKQKREKALKSIQHLIPVGINQQQQAEQVVQDIMGGFVKNFIRQDIGELKKVAQLKGQYLSLYSSIFKLYKSINIKVIPGSFILLKDTNTAKVDFQMIELIENSGRQVEATAAWTKISLQIKKKHGIWLKAEVGGS